MSSQSFSRSPPPPRTPSFHAQRHPPTYQEMPYYMYPPPPNGSMTYPGMYPPRPRMQYTPYPMHPFTIPNGDMAEDHTYDYNPNIMQYYSMPAPPPPPPPAEIYYAPSPQQSTHQRPHTHHLKTSSRLFYQEPRGYRDDLEDLLEKRSAVYEKLRNVNHNTNSSRTNSDTERTSTDASPDSLKDMLFDTLQQEMSALEVLKQQIASFTILSHSLQEKSGLNMNSSQTDSSTPQPSSSMDMSGGGAAANQNIFNNLPGANSPIPQAAWAGMPPNYPAQNMNHNPHTAMNFVNPIAYYQAQYPTPQSMVPNLQQQQSYSFNPYYAQQLQYLAQQLPSTSFSNTNLDGAPNTQVTTTQYQPGQEANTQSSYTTVHTPLTGTYNSFTRSPTTPLYDTNGQVYSGPNIPVTLLQNQNYGGYHPMPLYQAPKPSTPKHMHHRGKGLHAESFFPDFQDLAIKTMYEVEDRLRLAEQSIAEKINEFELEVADGSVQGPPTHVAPVAYEPWKNHNSDRRRSRSMSMGADLDRGFSSPGSAMDPTAVKELAVRALNAIDRRLRAAERTIDQTIHNFDEMDGVVRAVKASSRDVASQTPRRDTDEYESESDRSQRYSRGSD